jgi:polysaccharide export outer membrane protein
VSVYNVPELATKTRVSENGDIYLPLVDYVHVEGLTPEEAQHVVEKRYAEGGYLKDPHIAIFIDEYASQGVSVLGEVVRPGVYPVLGQRRLLDVISLAGGFTEKAGREVAITHRDRPDVPIIVQISRDSPESTAGSVDVFPGDLIQVRRADIVYIVGDVGRPSGLLMDTGRVSVLQAIALAGGPNHTAKLSASRIIRKDGSDYKEIPIPVGKMLSAKAPDQPLQPNDILFIPQNTAKIAAGKIAQAAVTAASTAAIVSVIP